MSIAVVSFPGSNCDDDARHAFEAVLGVDVRMVWHDETALPGVDAVVIPGGFSFGDYLRSGALAALSPVMTAVAAFASRGGPVLGICNGFQILTEARLLPGQLARNRSLAFQCRDVHLRTEVSREPFTSRLEPGQVLRLPIAHNEGSYYADDATLERLEGEGRVVFRYCDASGAVASSANVNGSANAIAGIVNEQGNVLGMMPHPERAVEGLLGYGDGLGVLASLAAAIGAAAS
ncbi:MAG TPA: phosphoribosylformylglycinamidine synthase subunit PurQ [Trueperaceae bacterium]|nr:phosphoribosylformylglycinamidine synthase subunit PurQ [Trueperaceae bacterium]